MFAPVPLHKTLVVYCVWLCTLLPYHKPDNIREPQWVRQWHRDCNAGVNMARYYPEIVA